MASMSGDKIDLVIDEDTQVKNVNRKRLLFILCGALWVLAIGILAGLVAVIIIKSKNDATICTTAHCVITAGELLSNIDPAVDPCDNFYEFACGGWLKRNTIPEEHSSYGTFERLRDQIDVILRGLLEKKKSNDDTESIRKAKDLYNSCIDLETIEAKNSTPLAQFVKKFGGWPVLGDKEGGSWNDANFDLETLLANLGKELGSSVSVIISAGVDIDLENSSKNILFIDQTGPIFPSRYYLEDQYANYKDAYFHYMIGITTLLGADRTTAPKDMADVLEFETKLANINWTKLFDILMPEETKPISRDETIINRSPVSTAQAAKLMRDTSPRIIANYMMWSISNGMISSLSKKFREVEEIFHKFVYADTTYGARTERPRWRECVSTTSGYLAFATGRMYIEEQFTGDIKKNIDKFITNLKIAFKEMLKDNDWIDEETKVAVREKVDAIREQIGFPEWITDDADLNKQYEKVDVNEDEYFENKANFLRYWAQKSLSSLRKPIEKNKWDTGLFEVNAWYTASANQITFPAAILQSPFYHPESPWYLNYGGIGTVIGHELTHGFDNNGRKFNKDGNETVWWSDESIDNFEKRAQCIIDQYSQYVVPENNRTINGTQTLGENIADNGGIRESLKAYRDNHDDYVKLPGFEDYSPEQLFFLNFAQIWCSKYRPEALDSQIDTDAHSTPRFRVIGTLHNSFDFAKAYNCPADSMMNPPAKDKCVLW
ncbi:membrane metallo-endopeptidase-like 1 isoform X2 [Amphiura filiformis]|uniref:membrane metallo-endopeptidase-like 1 isoform X2 n=1 Tax=Amphiura filiformis TaxID=82378 RepID=UPI003B223441